MSTIQLLYVENTISRKEMQVQQDLHFFMCLDNINFDKHVDVIWSGEEGVWQTLPATFHSVLQKGKEYWQARVSIQLSSTQSLPGNIQFSLRYRVSGEEYWDNNGSNYVSEADSGIQLPIGHQIQQIGFQACLAEEQTTVPLTIAVSAVNVKLVTIHWTVDDWETTQQSSCHYQHDYWHHVLSSNARNPNQYGVQLWTGEIDVADSFKVQYSVCCETASGDIVWDNNTGDNYCLKRKQLKVLILNLHCYQEENQDDKFTQIAKAIDELDADIVCLQEVAEFWNNGEGDWASNSARIINERLRNPFYLHADWSHLGFDQYREGVAILSRFPMSNQQSRYVSESHDIYSIHSRKVVMASVYVPSMGVMNIFSAHLSWIEDGFEGQFKNLHQWAEENHNDDIKATLLCGDFNITAGSAGYKLVVDSNHYDDQFLAANEQGVFETIFRVNDAHWHDLLADDYRIDYIFMNKSSDVNVTSADVIFTEHVYGKVSDHCGYLMTFEL
jgi:maltose 6'-phosphate phosphatase